MFSLQRPSPQVKCAFSISSSYVPAGWCAKSADGGVVGVGRRRDRRGRRVVVGVLRRSGRRCARCRSGTACRSAARSPGPAPGWRGCPRRGRSSVTYCGRPRARAGDEVAVRVGRDHRDVGHVRVDAAAGRASSAACFFVDAQVRDAGRCRRASSRYVCAGRQAAEQLAGRDRVAGGVQSRTRAGTPGARSARCRSGSGRPTACRCCSRPGCRRRVPSDAVRRDRAGSAPGSAP